MATILVTGAGGYIGSHATKRLLQDGHSVVALDNFSRGFREPLSVLKKYGNLEIVEGDVANKNDLEKVFSTYNIDAVMHFAALCFVDESVREPEMYFKNNTIGTANLLEVMNEKKVRKLIFSSTCAIYGNAKYLPMDELHPTAPENPYGESKYRAEQAIEKFNKIAGIEYVIFRYFNVSGCDEGGEIGDSKNPSLLLIQNAVRGALGIEQFFLTCPKVNTRDGTPVRDYVDVLDLVDAHIRALQYLNKAGKSVTLNLGNGVGWSVKEIVSAVEKELGVSINAKSSTNMRKGEYEEVYADIGKAKEVLDWQPKRNIKDIIGSLKNWYEKNPKGYKN